MANATKGENRIVNTSFENIKPNITQKISTLRPTKFFLATFELISKIFDKTRKKLKTENSRWRRNCQISSLKSSTNSPINLKANQSWKTSTWNKNSHKKWKFSNSSNRSFRRTMVYRFTSSAESQIKFCSTRRCFCRDSDYFTELASSTAWHSHRRLKQKQRTND